MALNPGDSPSVIEITGYVSQGGFVMVADFAGTSE
jgi:hypothetical protein